MVENLNFEKCSDGLIPAIIQDNNTLKVLMLGYMNSEALQATIDSGKVTFFSRTKGRMWCKGETSGNFLIVKSMEVDCDQDTLLIRVEPIGPTCHTGQVSCFNDNGTEGFIRELQSVIQKRREQMPEGSYTTRLFSQPIEKIAQKVGEEAVETVIEAVAGNDPRMIYEASDLIYHLLVLLTAKGYSIADLEAELVSRHK